MNYELETFSDVILLLRAALRADREAMEMIYHDHNLDSRTVALVDLLVGYVLTLAAYAGEDPDEFLDRIYKAVGWARAPGSFP